MLGRPTILVCPRLTGSQEVGLSVLKLEQSQENQEGLVTSLCVLFYKQMLRPREEWAFQGHTGSRWQSASRRWLFYPQCSFHSIHDRFLPIIEGLLIHIIKQAFKFSWTTLKKPKKCATESESGSKMVLFLKAPCWGQRSTTLLWTSGSFLSRGPPLQCPYNISHR